MSTITKSAFLNTRLEPELKSKAETVFRGLGVSTSEAVSMFLRQVVIHQGFPFPLRIPNKGTLEALAEDATKLSGYTDSRMMVKEILGKSK